MQQAKDSEGIYMIKYMDSVLQEFLDNLGVTASTPSNDHLFKVKN